MGYWQKIPGNISPAIFYPGAGIVVLRMCGSAGCTCGYCGSSLAGLGAVVVIQGLQAWE